MKVTFPELDLREAHRQLFRILNAAQPDPSKYLTDAEINLLSELCILPPKYEYHRFSRVAKKKVQESLKEVGWRVSMPSINQKIYSMIEKEILWRDEDKVVYLSKYIKGLSKSLSTSHANNKPHHILFIINPSTNGVEDNQ